jgi:hypothetical protein
MKENIEMLKHIQVLRMETKAQLNMVRFLQEQTGKSFEKEINGLLDRLNYLDSVERELRKK